MKNRDFRRSWANFCTYCGVRLCHAHRSSSEDPCGDESTWDHVVPGLQGSGITGRHKVVACADCNRDRGDKTPNGWVAGIKQRMDNGKMRPEFKEKAERILGLA